VTHDASPPGRWRERLVAAHPDTRLAVVDAHVRSVVAGVLRLPAAELDTRQPVNSLGLDSLMAIELRNRIEVDFGVAVPVAALLEGMTLGELAARLVRDVAGEGNESASQRVVNVLTRIEAMSDDEVDAMLGRVRDVAAVADVQ
jgi:acyl carrier protein